MKHRNRFLLAALTLPALAHAHDGHGLRGLSHWHATDVLGFLAVLAVAFLVWHGGRK